MKYLLYWNFSYARIARSIKEANLILAEEDAERSHGSPEIYYILTEQTPPVKKQYAVVNDYWMKSIHSTRRGANQALKIAMMKESKESGGTIVYSDNENPILYYPTGETASYWVVEKEFLV